MCRLNKTNRHDRMEKREESTLHTLKFKRISHPATLLFLFFLLIVTFLAEKTKNNPLLDRIPSDFLNFYTIFLSIVIEAIPFILLGSIASVLIQSYLRDDVIAKILPAHPIVAMLPASLVGTFFPVCECAIIPIIRGLIKKGLPQHLGIVMIVSIPILNPIVFLSTHYAFRNNPSILYARMGLAFVAALIIGSVVYFLFRRQSIVKKPQNTGHAIPHAHHHSKDNMHHDRPHFTEVVLHMNQEFLDTARYFLIGALLAATFQTFFDQHLLAAVGSSNSKGPAVMMGFAYLLSVCSTSDAFLAASMTGLFTPGSIIAFLLFGAMLDVKNTMMMLSCFKFRFVFTFTLVTAAVVYTLARLFDFFY